VKWALAREAGQRLETLEHKVLERTRELSAVNEAMRKEIGKRERMELELVRAQKWSRKWGRGRQFGCG
jgi:C4-dicarboxylate-specific signal transduction histidine kinase